MGGRFPRFAALCIFTIGSVSAVGCGRSTGAADGSPAPVSKKDLRPAPQGPDPDPAAQSQAQTILLAALRTLEGRSSISAKIRHQVDLFDRQLVGSGVYFQQRSGEHHLIRLELRIQAGDQQSSVLQVLSPPSPKGHYLWIHRKLSGEEKLSRIDVVRAAAALEEAEKVPGRGPEGIMHGAMGGYGIRAYSPSPGGVPRLLRGLQAAFDFSSAQKGRFDRTPVWRLLGHWKPDRLAKMLPDRKAAIEAGEPADLSKLAEHLPDHVVLMLGQEDLFPRRIEYRRGIAQKDGRRDDSRALVTMELWDVKLDVPIDRTRFIYNPGNTTFTDETESFISSLRATR